MVIILDQLWTRKNSLFVYVSMRAYYSEISHNVPK